MKDDLGFALIGKQQSKVIERARRSKLGAVIPANFLERRACKRLVARGIMQPMISFPDVWELTERGHAVVLVIEKNEVE